MLKLIKDNSVKYIDSVSALLDQLIADGWVIDQPKGVEVEDGAVVRKGRSKKED